VLLTTWAVTAVWDGVCASALSIVGYGSTLSALWSGVAAIALRGPREPGLAHAALGLLVHTGVALLWSALFVWVVFQSSRVRRTLQSWSGAMAVAAVYGPLVWLVMSLGVIPFATGRGPALGMRWWVQLVAHVPFVALPMAIAARTLLRSAGVRRVEQAFLKT
jgi:hypothetical protein